MSGPILLMVLIAVIVLIVKYPTHTKNVFANVGKAVKAVNGNPAATKPGNGGEQEWFRKNLWPILLAIAGAVILYFGLYVSKWENPSLRSSVSWTLEHWLWVLLFAGIIYFLIGKISGVTAKTLQFLLMGVLFMLFIGFPVWTCFVEWYNTPSSSRSHSQNESAQILKVQANGDSIRLNPPVGVWPEFTGNGFEARCVFPDGHEGSYIDPRNPCTGGYTSVYVRDLSGSNNEVTYKYVRH